MPAGAGCSGIVARIEMVAVAVAIALRFYVVVAIILLLLLPGHVDRVVRFLHHAGQV